MGRGGGTPPDENVLKDYVSGSKHRSSGSNRRRKRTNSRTLVYLACCLLVSCLLAGIGWLLVNDVCSLNKAYVETEITVEEGDSRGDVAKKLHDAGLVNSKLVFSIAGTLLHYDRYVEPGTYKLNSDMDFRALITHMHDWESDSKEAQGLVRVTIPEGYTVREIIDLLAEKGVATKEDLEDACANFEYADYDFLDSDKLGSIDRMEGFLFPTTQAFDPEKTAVYDIDTMLTNFVTIRSRVQRMEELEAMETDGRMEVLPKKEQILLRKELAKLQTNLNGIRNMKKVPDMVFVIDTNREQIAIHESHRLNIPIVGTLDTNCDPDDVDYGIPANDDAIRSVRLLADFIADAVIAGTGAPVTVEEMTAEATEEAPAEAAAEAATEAAAE